MNLLDILIKGGFLMIPIGICSIVAIIIIIERYLVLAKAKVAPDFIDKCKSRLEKNDKEGLLELCKIYDSPVARVIKEGVEKNKEAMVAKANNEVLFLERRLSILATISGIAPLLGFLGTVWGMILAFMQVEKLGGNVNASVLAGGIWQALVTTLAGLAVAIVVHIFYNHLVDKVKNITQILQSTTTEWK